MRPHHFSSSSLACLNTKFFLPCCHGRARARDSIPPRRWPISRRSPACLPPAWGKAPAPALRFPVCCSKPIHSWGKYNMPFRACLPRLLSFFLPPDAMSCCCCCHHRLRHRLFHLSYMRARARIDIYIIFHIYIFNNNNSR